MNKKTNHKALDAFLNGLKTNTTLKTKLASPELSRKSWNLRIILMKKTIKKTPIRSCKIKIMLTAMDTKKVNQASRSHLWLWKATE